MSRLPERDMFQLTQDEHDRFRSQNVALKWGPHLEYLPYDRSNPWMSRLSSNAIALCEYCFDPKAILINPLQDHWHYCLNLEGERL